MPDNRHNAAVFARGPRFFDGEDGLMFEITLDARSKIGPRPALDADKAAYPDAWGAYSAGVEPFEASPHAPLISTHDDPDAKAAHEAEAAKHQAALDKKRRGGL